jgi:CysZ protein
VNTVVRSLLRAVPLLGDRRVLALALLPLVAAIPIWIVAAYLLWTALSHAFAGTIARWVTQRGGASAPGWLATTGGEVATFVLLTLAVGALVLAAFAVLATPVFVRAVESRHFPALERKHGGTLAGGVANAAMALAIWLVLWIVVLPLLLFPFVGVPASLGVNAWFNARLFRYDALSEHASADERAAVFRAARSRLLALGFALAPLSFVPIVNLVAPLYAGLAFTCLCLDELATLRVRSATPGSGERA